MVTILKVYKKGCTPCEEVSKTLSQVETKFILEELDIEDSKFAIRRKAKGLLGGYGTTNIPLLVFVKDGEKDGYAAHYYEQGTPSVSDIELTLQRGMPVEEKLT